MHVDPADYRTEIGDEVTIRHGAIIHGCRLRNRAVVSMGATVLDRCAIHAGSAGALLPPARVIGRNETWVGVPAHFQRTIPVRRQRYDFREYVQNTARVRVGLHPITPARHEGE